MLRKLTFGVAFGAGYVLGAKAGVQRYEQIMAKSRELAGKPAVQGLRDTVTTQVADAAEQLGDKAKTAANEAMAGVAAKVAGDSDDAPSATPPVATVDLTASAVKPAPTPAPAQTRAASPIKTGPAKTGPTAQNSTTTS